MERQEQKRFIVEICNGMKKALLVKVHDIPENWDGFELRQWVKDFVECNYCYAKMSRYRKREYNNDVIVKNLL